MMLENKDVTDEIYLQRVADLLQSLLPEIMPLPARWPAVLNSSTRPPHPFSRNPPPKGSAFLIRPPTQRCPMAKSKINLRFIFILIIVVGVIAVLLMATYVLKIQKDPTRNIVAADELLKQGNKDDALKQLQRAVLKSPENIEYVQKTEDLLLSIRPETRDRARELYNLRLGLLQHQANYRPSDIQVQLKLVQELYNFALFVQQGSVWQSVIDAAQDIDRRFPTTDPNHAYGRLYRGYGAAFSSVTPSPSRTSRPLWTTSRLQHRQPGFRRRLGHAPFAQLQILGDYQRRSETQRAVDKLAEFDADLKTAMQRAPDGPEVPEIPR